MKKKHQYKKIIILISISIIIISTIIYGISKSKEPSIQLTQLAPQSPRQMMGYLLKTSTNKLIVIDGGTLDDTQHLIEKINENGGKVDYWFLTHAHDDHVGAFTQIVNDTDIEINKVYTSVNDLSWYEKYEPSRAEFTKKYLEVLDNEKIKDKVIEPNLNDVFYIDNIKVEILGIKNPDFTENPGNEQSMVIKFDTKKNTLLILGDTGLKSSDNLLKTQKDKLKCDIVQMAHHGQSGASKELYTQINPTICLWPTPEWLWNNDNGNGINSGEWKTLEVRQWMEDLKVTQNYVAKDGDITISIE